MTFRQCAALIMASMALAGCQQAPYTGRQQLMLIGEKQELKLGLDAYQDILAKEKISTNPAYNATVQRVGKGIAAVAGRPDYNWEFKVIDNDKTANAFCLPGGKVAVYTGLFKYTQDDAGLAAVIGHEVGHAIARHGAERMSDQLLTQSVVAAGAIGLGALGNRDAGTYAALLGAGATVGFVLPMSRTQESEADRLGLVLMAKAGYDPHAAVDVWKRMAARGGSRPPEILSTHPADQTRIGQIEAWLPEAMKYYRPAKALATTAALR